MFCRIPRTGPTEPARFRRSPQQDVRFSASPTGEAFGVVPGVGRAEPGLWPDHRHGAYSRGGRTATRRARAGTGGVAADCRGGLRETGSQPECERRGGVARGGCY